jgi:L-rhamnose mutarotase
MQRVAFKMQLHRGFEQEYAKRHEKLWPELTALLKETGVADYSIFLDEATLSLFGVLKVADKIKLDELPSHPVMQKWWAYMKDHHGKQCRSFAGKRSAERSILFTIKIQQENDCYADREKHDCRAQ